MNRREAMQAILLAMIVGDPSANPKGVSGLPLLNPSRPSDFRVAYYTAMFGQGALTINEMRAAEGLPPLKRKGA